MIIVLRVMNIIHFIRNMKNQTKKFWIKRFYSVAFCLKTKSNSFDTYYTTKEFKMPTAKTSRNQIPIPENTVRLFSIQPSGVAKTTGTPTTKRKETIIKSNHLSGK